MKTLQDSLEKSKNLINSLDNEKLNIKEAKQIEELKNSLEEKRNKVNALNKEINNLDENKKELEESKNSVINRKKNLFQQISDSEKEKLKLENKLKDEEEKFKKLKEKENILNEEKNNKIKLKRKERDDAINKIKKEVENKIKQLREERAKKITYEDVNFIDPYDYNSLVCTRCKKNCNLNCECFTIFGLFKITSLCERIKDSYCIMCGCHTDYHKRGKFFYKGKKRQKSLSPGSKRKTDNDISNLEKSIKTQTENREKEYNIQIYKVERAYNDEIR